MQATGECVSGSLQGKRLQMIPSRVMPWKTWATLHPKTRVLDGVPIRTRPGTYLLSTHEADFGFALGSGTKSKLYPLPALKKHSVLNDIAFGVPVVVMYSQSPRIVQAYHRGDRKFRAVGGQLLDEQGHSYDALAPRDPDTGALLKPVVMTPWLMKQWHGFHPRNPVFGLEE